MLLKTLENSKQIKVPNLGYCGQYGAKHLFHIGLVN
jgi:hypothetical protein